jgi:hypothetical protein
MAVVFGDDLDLARLEFGGAGAEFTQLAKGLSKVEMTELLHYYSAQYEQAEDDLPVPSIPPSSTQEFDLSDVDDELR